jgi:hypothetical protein
MPFLKYLFVFFILSFQSLIASEYREKIQPIFDNRCIACHSCLNGPCQLNLQNYDNFARGATHKNVYDGLRIDSVVPTRPGIDAKKVVDWRKLGFYDVNQSRNLEENIFYQILGVKKLEQKDIPFKTTEESIYCIDTAEQLKLTLSQSSDLQMPYALPPLTDMERNTLGTWLANGATGPETLEAPAVTHSQIKLWENFFNQKSEKEKLVNRYMFEHLYLAHIYFPEAPTSFFRLVRSFTSCEQGIDEIATRRANDNPHTKDFYYCLKLLDSTNVSKTHMPFEFNLKVMERMKKNFFEDKWEISKIKTTDESYSFQSSENPFIAFHDIPVKARYQFLLDNAHFIISTFIKGPVCNGTNAVNSIQEQFYVMFITPESDNMVRSKEFADKAQDLLVLPGVWGSDIKLKTSIELTEAILKHREGYRKLRADETTKNFPKGYAINDLWDGDAHNPNALLTIFRHNDNAAVLKGFHGDLPKTLFFLDYALFERLVYNLVVNFDVYGNVSHQMLTRVYMDMIRMEAEEMFLSFLPPVTRVPLRNSWYKGLFTEAKMKYLFPYVDGNRPTQMKYKSIQNAKKEFVEQVLFSYLKPEVTGKLDTLNVKSYAIPDKAPNQSAFNASAKVLRDLASNKAVGTKRYPNFFPENSYIVVNHENAAPEIYTIIKNREHENVSWILAESLRLAPKEDTLTILRGYYSYYPNQFFVVNDKTLVDFKNKALKIKTKEDYKNFSTEFAVSRVSGKFWPTYDLINATMKKEEPIEFGYLDLSRYLME